MANEKTPVVWDDDAKKHRPLGSGEKMGGLSASSMISADSGNLLQQGSDGLMLVTGSSLADPRADNLLEESENGKLQVTSDRVVEWLDGHPQAAAAIADAVKVVSGDDGNVIVQGTDKGAYLPKQAISSAVSGMTDAQKNQLADAISPRIASDIADGQTLVASNGKLTFNPTNATAAQKKAINQALADADSGLVVNNSTGKLGVDFSNMPTDKFEELLKGLKMQVPLDRNVEFHVDRASSAAGDTIIDGRGTAAKPFKTIQACVDYVTSTYAIGIYHATIKIHPGIYTESLILSQFTVTRGYIELAAYDFANPPQVTNVSENSSLVSVTGTQWRLRRIYFSATRYATNDGINHFVHIMGVGSGGAVTVYGCKFEETYTGAAPVSGATYIRMIEVNGSSTLSFMYMDDYGTEIHTVKGNASYLSVFQVGEGSTVNSYSSSSSSSVVNIECWGSFTVFATISANSNISLKSGGTYIPHFVVKSGQSASGKRYSIDTGGGASLADSGTFPGDVDGTVDSSTCGWYQGG